MPVSVYYQRWRLRFSCRRIGRANGLDIFPYCASAVQLSRTGWGGRKESRRNFTRTCSVFSMHESRLGERMREKHNCASTVQFSLMGGWEEKSPSVSLLPVVARLVFMPLDRECKRAGHLNLFRIHR